MSQPACQPLMTLVSPSDREERPDRLGELLECLADLVVETERCRAALASLPARSDERVRCSIVDLERLQVGLHDVSVEAAAVHQRLRRERLL
jgi:hypothetical protein